MRTTLIALAAAAPVLALPAAAAAQQKQPTRDFAATYRMEHEGRSAEMRVAYSVTLGRQRVEMPETGIVVIHDGPGKRMLMLNEPLRMAMEMPLSAGRNQALTIPEDMVLTRTGSATVAGHACTLYRAEQNKVDRGTVCLTADGIMLRANLSEGGRAGTMEATALTIAAQPAAQFEVPQGWQTMQMPSPPPQNPGQNQRR